jgi:hypothetical protein
LVVWASPRTIPCGRSQGIGSSWAWLEQYSYSVAARFCPSSVRELYIECLAVGIVVKTECVRRGIIFEVVEELVAIGISLGVEQVE